MERTGMQNLRGNPRCRRNESWFVIPTESAAASELRNYGFEEPVTLRCITTSLRRINHLAWKSFAKHRLQMTCMYNIAE